MAFRIELGNVLWSHDGGRQKLCGQLEVAFGPRHNTNGVLPINERGPGICAIVSVLEECSATDLVTAKVRTTTKMRVEAASKSPVHRS